MDGREESFHNACDHEQRNTPQDQAAGLPASVEQSVFSWEVPRKKKGPSKQKPCSACNENRRQFNDAVGKHKGPEGDAQVVAVTEARKSPDNP